MHIYKCRRGLSWEMSGFALFSAEAVCHSCSPSSQTSVNTSSIKHRQDAAHLLHRTQSLHELPNVLCSFSLHMALAMSEQHQFPPHRLCEMPRSNKCPFRKPLRCPNTEVCHEICETKHPLWRLAASTLLRECLLMPILPRSSFTLALLLTILMLSICTMKSVCLKNFYTSCQTLRNFKGNSHTGCGAKKKRKYGWHFQHMSGGQDGSACHILMFHRHEGACQLGSIKWVYSLCRALKARHPMGRILGNQHYYT